MNLEHHELDIAPVPKEKEPLFINEPWLVDASYNEYLPRSSEPDKQDDNIRVYVPLDINKGAILRRLDHIIGRYGEANYDNEMDFSIDVGRLIWQIEIYDQVWCGRHASMAGKHSTEAVELVKEVVSKLEQIPDGCAEMFPFELIDEMREEFLRG